MKTVMISLPMNGRSDDAIKADIERSSEYLKSYGFDTIANTLFEDDPEVKHPAVWYLGNALIKMSSCDAVYFMRGWEDARGCQIEHAVAEKYGLEIIYEV